MMIPKLVAMVVAAAMAAPINESGENHDMLTPVPFTDVRIDDAFWRPRLETNRTVTVPYCFDKCEETGRIDNFAKAGGLMEGPHIGHRYNDSDVFKVIEGASYSLQVQRDPKLEAYLDDLIAKIDAAQEPDGYLFTTRTIDPGNPAPASGPRRWSQIRDSHELYNVGHLYEAAVAYFQATGKRSLLDVALKNADLIDRVFGPDGRHDPPGHEEIEIGLVKLYRVTGERRYLELAKFFIDQRGRADSHELFGEYAQDAIPVVEQSGPIGHAVRAMYLYCGMADVAKENGDTSYLAALDRIWNDMVRTKLYITGGVGARHHGEAFGGAFELPNASAYNETCAAVGNALWNHRMNMLHRDGRYADVLERVLYNGFLAGVSMTGDRFFYPNPLASSGTHQRSAWFSCSCCPVNVVRFVPSVAGYVYAHDEAAIFVNLFVAGSAEVRLPDNVVRITQATAYPWDGRVVMSIEPESSGEFDIAVRIPGWARGEPVPSPLYQYVETTPAGRGFSITCNGEPIEQPLVEKGYVRLHRTWKGGDTVTLDLDMPIRRVRADENVEPDRGRLALERGPVVYCLEGVDHHGRVQNLVLPADARLAVEARPDLLGGVVTITGEALALRRDEPDEAVQADPVSLTAIPYYAWQHRGPSEMLVWIPTDPALARVTPPPTVASMSRVTASHCYEGDSPLAVNDQQDPEGSGDHAIPRLTWWDHRGTDEWVQYDFSEPLEVSAAAVYWFDDTGVGQCRVPERWRLLYREGDA
ncbi:MAG: glycoside hydrolase family 127 protein, partial [Planctomycetota bacterium]